ncbi:MAG: hypothetical protein KAT17_03390 [Candidatus Aminicenantes bacterium]|nr:hypothetical protein [Candidatus Aminicenantes bacterium]
MISHGLKKIKKIDSVRKKMLKEFPIFLAFNARRCCSVTITGMTKKTEFRRQKSE